MRSKKLLKAALLSFIFLVLITGCIIEPQNVNQSVSSESTTVNKDNENKVVETDTNQPSKSLEEEKNAIIQETIKIYDNILNDR